VHRRAELVEGEAAVAVAVGKLPDYLEVVVGQARARKEAMRLGAAHRL
jgi:hypothetical protein